MSRDDIVRAVALRGAADVISDRYMPGGCGLSSCATCDPARFQVRDTVLRITAALNAEADRLDPARTDEWDIPAVTA